MHYQRWKAHGSPNTVLQIRGDAERRFNAKVQPADDGCLLWLGARGDTGYGTFWDGIRDRRAHVWAWERENGTVPGGLELDHLCRHRSCVNPAHLEAVTHAENMKRSAPATKLRCIRDHVYAEHGYVNSQGRRVCRLCDDIRSSARRVEDHPIAAAMLGMVIR
jgi:hypothetical protein